MSFLQREHDKLNEMLRSTPSDDPRYHEIYMAQQAIGWALDPDLFMSPSGLVNKWRGIGGGTNGTGVQFGHEFGPGPASSLG